MNRTDLNAHTIKEKLELEIDRGKVSLYLSKRIYRDFKRACGQAPASRVMEELMKKFIENSLFNDEIKRKKIKK